MKKFLLLLSVFTINITGILHAQDYPGSLNRMGLSASINTSQFSILVPFFLNPRTSVAPGIELRYAQNIGNDIGLGLNIKSYFKPKSSVFPYLGIKGGVFWFTGGAMGTQIDWLTGLALGVEYFFTSQFSVGIEPQLNITFSDDNSNRFGNPGKMNMNTATMITANIYF